MNRAERRAIAYGTGRHKPMIEIVDVYSADDYAFDLYLWCGDRASRIFDNTNRLFITYQLSYLEVTDTFAEEPCLLY